MAEQWAFLQSRGEQPWNQVKWSQLLLVVVSWGEQTYVVFKIQHGKTWKLQNCDWRSTTWRVRPIILTCQQILREDWKIKHIRAMCVSWWLTYEEQRKKFWLLKIIVITHPHSKPLICPFVIYCCFWERESSFESIVSRMCLKFRNSHWPSYMWFQKVRSYIGRTCCINLEGDFFF